MKKIIQFLAMAFMLSLSLLSNELMKNSHDLLLLKGSASFALYKALQLPVVLVAGWLLYLYSKKASLDRLFGLFFSLAMLLFGLLGILKLFNYKLFCNATFLGLLSLCSSLFLAISTVVIWGFANQVYTFKRAAIHYPLFYLVASGATLVVPQVDNVYLVISLFSLLILAIHSFMTRQTTDAEKPASPLQIGTLVALGALVFGSVFCKFFPDIALKESFRNLYTSSRQQLAILAEQRTLANGYSLFAGITGVVLGLFLAESGPKKLFAVGITLIAIMTCAILYFFSTVQHNFHKALHARTLFLSFLPLLLLLIKELAYFGINKAQRFQAKLILDLMLISLANLLAERIIHLAPGHTTLITCSVIGMAVALYGLYRYNTSFKPVGSDLLISECTRKID